VNPLDSAQSLHGDLTKMASSQAAVHFQSRASSLAQLARPLDHARLHSVKIVDFPAWR
jgi:hypothetical protein